MEQFLDYLPFAAAAFAIPQYLPQIVELRRTHDITGVSWPWATLTSVNNAAWFVYFVLSAYWTALVPSTAATILAGTLAVMFAARGLVSTRAVIAICCWATLLVMAYAIAGLAGLGTVLTGASIVQVAPSVWTAYRTANPTGISRGTWALVFGELLCWTIYGFCRSDPRLIALGVTGVAAAVLMLARTIRPADPALCGSASPPARVRR